MDQPNEVLVLVADVVIFLAAVRLLGVAALSRGPGSARSRVFLATASLDLGVASFLHGSKIVEAVDAPELVVLRLLAASLLVLSCLPQLAPGQGQTLIPAAGLFVVAELLFVAERPDAAIVVMCLATIAVGAGVMAAMRGWFALRAAAVGSALIIAMVVALAVLVPLAFSRGLREEEQRRADDRAFAEVAKIEQIIDRTGALAEASARVLVRSPRFAAGVAGRDPVALREALAATRILEPGLDVLAYFPLSGGEPISVGASADDVRRWRNLPGTPLAAAGEPSGGVGPMGDGDVLAALGFAQARLSSEDYLSFAAGPLGYVAPLGSSPGSVPPPGNPGPFGVIVAGTRLDPTMLSRGLGQAKGVDVSLFQASSASTTRAERPDGVGGLLDAGAEARALERAAREKRAGSVRGTFKGVETFVSIVPVVDSAGEVTAMLAVSADGHIDPAVRDSVLPVLFLVLALPASLLLVVGVVAGVRMERPVAELTRAARRIEEGDLTAALPRGIARRRGHGDMASLGASLASMAGSLGTLEMDLRGAEARLRAILGGMTEGLLATDERGLVVLANTASEEIVGQPALGRPIERVLVGVDRNGVNFGELLGRDPSEGSWFAAGVLRRGDEQVPVSISGAPILGSDGGSFRGSVFILRDVSSEFEVEQMKTEFLAGISHELRTPLAPIRGYAEMLRRPDLADEQARRFVDAILESSSELERVVGILVDYATIEADRFSVRLAPVDVPGLLRSIEADWRQRVPDRAWSVEVDGQLLLDADERLLRRSLEELVDNAVRYSPPGSPITLRGRWVEPDVEGRPALVALAVEDAGEGPTPKALAALHVEDPFASGSIAAAGGFGLGLPYAMRVARAHGGRLVAERREAGGSVFAIEIPRGA